MQMRDDDLAHLSAFGDHFVDTRRKSFLLILPWRSGIDNQHLFGVVNDVATGVSCRWTRWCANRKTDVVRSKRDPATDFAMRMWNRQETVNEIRSDAGAESSQCVQCRRHSNNLIL